MRTDRLLKLASFLETVPDESFTMRSWQKRAASKPEGEKPGECGFAGCAVGWAVHGNLFDGLSFVLEWDGATVPKYQNKRGWDAVEALFEIGPSEAIALFGPYDARSPAEVANKIRKFVKRSSSSSEAAATTP